MTTLLANHWYTIGWIGWIIYFVVLETIAVIDQDTGDTLSEHVWFVAYQPVIWWLLAGFLMWLTLHFLGFGKLG